MNGEKPSSPSSGWPTERSLGLSHLTPEQLSKMDILIRNWAPWLISQYQAELKAVRNGAAVAVEEIDVESLAASSDPEERSIAASAIASYAESEPGRGFPLWAKLITDEHGEVERCAEIALISSLGRRTLDSRGVALVIDAWLPATVPPSSRV